MVISGGWDNTVKIQKLTLSGNSQGKISREIINMNSNKPVTLLELSVYHNILVTASNSPYVHIWDYEYAKLLQCIEFKNNVEATSITFAHGFSILLIATNEGIIYVL